MRKLFERVFVMLNIITIALAIVLAWLLITAITFVMMSNKWFIDLLCDRTMDYMDAIEKVIEEKVDEVE